MRLGGGLMMWGFNTQDRKEPPSCAKCTCIYVHRFANKAGEARHRNTS